MWKQKFFVLIFLIFSKCKCDEENIRVDYRLPKNSIPLRYEIWLKVNLKEGFETFFGHVKIYIKIQQATDLIKLHASQLHVKKITFFDRHLPYSYDIKRDFLIVKLPNVFEAGSEVILDISYAGKILENTTKGFMLGSYDEGNETDIKYIFTHFEPTLARLCIPCYDEPGIRAVFSVKIEHDSSYEALSNMPVLSRDNTSDNYVITTFRDTPPMQSYLLAFFVHKFAVIENFNQKIPQRIFMRPSLIDNKFINELIHKLNDILEALENYFEIPFMLPKVDIIFAPGFKSAIENWGLIGCKDEFIRNVSIFDDLYLLKTLFHEMTVSINFPIFVF